MRTTLDIDNDVLAAARDLARAEGKSLGEILSDLVRKALTAPNPASAGFDEPGIDCDHGAWPALPNRQGVVVTTELIDRLQVQLDREDAGVADAPVAPVAPARQVRRRVRKAGD